MSYVACPNCGVSVESAAAAEPPTTCPDCCARLSADGGLSRPSPRWARDQVLDAIVLSGRDAPRMVRHEFESFARPFGRDVATVGALLVSELVTNAVVHGPGGLSSTIELHASARGGTLHVEVDDEGAGFAPAEDPDGWGLHLVDSLAAAWGIAGGDSTRVWFDLPLQ